MGQYYKPVNIDNGQWLYSHKYENGLKLMEHSYIGNNFVGVVEQLLAPGQPWWQNRIVWAGDYADPEKDNKHNLYSLLEDRGEINPHENDQPEINPRFIINHNKKLYVDKDKHKGKPSIHPLPLLTCEGNGRGGGDFNGEDPNDLIGSWARCRISVAAMAPEGYEELEFNLTE